VDRAGLEASVVVARRRAAHGVRPEVVSGVEAA
jgi:hypothetical protein